jgi:N utilization substance protein B
MFAALRASKGIAMTRGNARELAVHLIYGRNFTGEAPEQVVAARLQKEYYEQLAEENDVYSDRPSRAQLRYIDNAVMGVSNREEELNAFISKFSIGWDISRISRLARAILQLAIYEILYIEDVPTGAAISEAVRIAKKYDGDDTGSFINGILGSFARSLTTQEETV